VARSARPRELFTELAFYFYKTLHFVFIKIILLCYFVGFVQALCGALRAPIYAAAFLITFTKVKLLE
jgi:hypothetical protein